LLSICFRASLKYCSFSILEERKQLEKMNNEYLQKEKEQQEQLEQTIKEQEKFMEQCRDKAEIQQQIGEGAFEELKAKKEAIAALVKMQKDFLQKRERL
jgi:short-subunit dehydrogenase involved in D-alanine esterification of teichoic acids